MLHDAKKAARIEAPCNGKPHRGARVQRSLELRLIAKKQRKKTQMLAKIMQIEEVRAIVEKTNCFSRSELEANRELIRLVRREKKERLATLGGSHIGMLVDQAKTHGYILSDVREKEGKKTDTMTITLKRQNQKTEAERIQEEIRKLTEKLNRVTSVAV
jgi:hypothetical protein